MPSMVRRVILCTLLLRASAFAQASPSPPAAPLPQSTAAITQPLILSDAVAFAHRNNPTLLSLERHLAAVRSGEITAGLRQNPVFAVTGQMENLPAGDQNGPRFNGFGLQRTFELGGKRDLRLQVARSTTALTQAQTADQIRQADLQVRQAFVKMLQAKMALTVSNDNLKDYKRTVELMQARLQIGDVSQTDFDRIDLQLAGFESDAINAKLAVDLASNQLQALLGIAHPSASFDIAGSLTPPLLLQTLTELEQQGIANRPDLAAALQQQKVNESSIRLADALAKPDPTVGAEYERSGSANTFGFSLNVPLRIFDRNQGERQRTRYEAQSSQFAITAAQNQVIADIDQAYATYEASRIQTERYRTHYLDEAAHVRDNLQFSYRNGNTTLLDYLSALQDYRQVNLASLNANAQALLALHQLSYAVATEVAQ